MDGVGVTQRQCGDDLRGVGGEIRNQEDGRGGGGEKGSEVAGEGRYGISLPETDRSIGRCLDVPIAARRRWVRWRVV